MTAAPRRLLVIFDGDCGFCTGAVRLLEALDRHSRISAEPYQKPGIPASAGLSVEECQAYAWAVAPDGRRYRGAAAINASLATALGTRLPLLLYELPPVSRLQDLAYDWVAANRGRLPGVKPYCAR